MKTKSVDINTWNRLFSVGLALLLVVFASSGAFAQAHTENYSTTTFTATWTDISATGTSFSLSDVHAYADGYTTISLPFAFNYDSTEVSSGSDLTVSAGGAITFGDATANVVEIGSSGTPGVLGIFNGEAVVIGTGNHSTSGYYEYYYGWDYYTGYYDIPESTWVSTSPYTPSNTDYYKVDGSSPNRVFTIQLDEVHFQGDGGGGNNTSMQTTMQVKLYEATNVIEFIYLDHSHSFGNDNYDAGSGCSIGLNGFTSPSFTYNTYASGLTATPSSDLRFTPTYVYQTRRMKLSRSSISLGLVRVGRPHADSLKVISNGIGGAITISSSMKSGTLFSRYPTTSNRMINAGSSEIDSAIFTPTARGIFNDSILFTTNSDTLTQQHMGVYVSGQGVQAIFHSVSSTTLAFGNVRLGRTTQQTFSFSNIGDDTLFLQTPTIASSGFNVISASLTVPPNQTGSIVVQFAPTVWQTYSGILTLSALNGVSATSITLGGIGTLPQIQVSNAAAFGPVRVGTQRNTTIAFTNTGNDTLHLSNAAIAQPSTRFTLGAYDQAVLPGMSGAIHISYAPNQRGFDTASLRFTTDDPAHPTETVLLTGQGIQAIFHSTSITPMVFADLHVGLTEQKTFSFTNSGDDTLFLQTPSVSGNSFRLISGPPSLTVLPGQTSNAVVQFAPLLGQSYTGILSFTASNGVTAPTVTLGGNGTLPRMSVATNRDTIDLGQVKVNASAIYNVAVTNTGTSDLNLTGVTATPLPFSLVTWGPRTVGAGTIAYAVVAFTPTAIGRFQGRLVIAGDDPSNPSDTVFLTGTGINSALSIDPASLNFGPVPVSSTVQDTIKLSNTGTASVTINSYTLTPESGAFAIVNSPATTISGGGTALVIVSFRPDTTGIYGGMLTLATDDASAPIRTVNLSGLGVKGSLIVVPSSIDFGTVTIGRDSTIRASLKNTGSASVTINSIAMTGNAFSHGTLATPLTIDAGASTFVDLTFTPTLAGDATGSVSFTLGDNTSVTVTLHGFGVDLADVPKFQTRGMEIALSVSPNPAKSSVMAHIVLAQASDGRIEIFDVTGHAVVSLSFGLLSQGAYDVSLPVENLASGSYFVRITNANGDAAAARLVLER